ncbi:hypothetical protein JOE11_002096 [Robbsia andropogonis]
MTAMHVAGASWLIRPRAKAFLMRTHGFALPRARGAAHVISGWSTMRT